MTKEETKHLWGMDPVARGKAKLSQIRQHYLLHHGWWEEHKEWFCCRQDGSVNGPYSEVEAYVAQRYRSDDMIDRYAYAELCDVGLMPLLSMDESEITDPSLYRFV